MEHFQLCNAENLNDTWNDALNENCTNPDIFFFTLQKGLKNVFDEAILAALEPPEPKKSRKCQVL